jgi:ribose/xylose/arabinose/galactoside ABC-type transport system permease subunit
VTETTDASSRQEVAASDSLGDGPRLQQAWAATRHFRPVLVLLVLLTIGMSFAPGFLTLTNIENLLTAVAVLWIVAIGMTFALIGGGADLSVGALGALVGIVMAKLLALGVPGGFAVLAAVLAGTVVGGAINGVLIGRFGLSFFLVTLASMTALTGVVNLWSNTESFFVTAPVAGDIGVNHYLGLPAPIWLMIAAFVIALYVQRRTYFGRDVYAVGGSITAAKLSGIRTARTLIAVYAVVAFCASVSGIVVVGQIGAASPQVNQTLPLQAIAAILLGGTSLSGGQGGVGGTALGVLFIGVLQNGLSIANVSGFWQQVVTGVILVAAVLGSRLSTGRRGRGLAPRLRLGHRRMAQ